MCLFLFNNLYACFARRNMAEILPIRPWTQNNQYVCFAADEILFFPDLNLLQCGLCTDRYMKFKKHSEESNAFGCNVECTYMTI